MWTILPDLFLGDRADASDQARLRKQGITHIVNCSKELPCYFEGQFEYLWLKLEDPDPGFSSKISRFCAFIDDARRDGKVLVHCTGAVSRSPAVIFAYLCHLHGSMNEAVARLSGIVPTGIDESFLYQLALWSGTELSVVQMQSLQQELLGRAR